MRTSLRAASSIRIVRVVLGLLLCSSASMCGDEHEAVHSTPSCTENVATQWLTIRPGESVELADGLATLAMRATHPFYRRPDAFTTTAPYLEIDGKWLELVDDVIVADGLGSRVLRVQLTGCETEARQLDDYVIRELALCRVAVNAQCARSASPVVPEPLHYVARLRSRDVATEGSIADMPLSPRDSGRLAVRSTGFDVGFVDTSAAPWEVKTASFGLDVVTRFGVLNLDFDDTIDPIIGHTEHVTVGPYKGTVRVLDIANSSTRCTDACRDILDIAVDLEPVSPKGLVPRIVQYVPVHF